MQKTINLDESDLESSFIEVTQETIDAPRQKMVLYDKNYYEYLYTVNLKEYLVEGKNQIEIKFKSNSFPNKINSYRIVNWISYKNGNVSFLKKEFSIDLE